MIWYLSPKAVDSAGTSQVSDAQIAQIIEQPLCRLPCQAANPARFCRQAPLGIVLETPAEILNHAERIAFTVQTRYMPIGNLTGMTDQERASVASWYAQIQQP